jgi:protein-S-isoprenylcysteine O-methyltransferase Ste14
MGIGVSIFLIAAGAVLTFAIDASVQGVSLTAIGWILMIVGALGLVWALVAAATAHNRQAPAHREVVQEEPRY